MTKILMIHTGGTISMHTNSSGTISSSTRNPLLDVMAQAKDLTIEQLSLFNVPSPHMDHQKMLRLSQMVNERAADYDGVVITHGTDTLEETAYFLDLTVSVVCPVVVTGAMRSTDQIGTDAIANCYAAILVAASDEARHQGVLVVLNDQIFAARSVTKTNTTNLATFQAPMTGPIGHISDGIVRFQGKIPAAPVHLLEQVSARVCLIKAYAGMTDLLLRSLTAEMIDGLVIEAMGAGNLPPQVLPAIKSLMEQKIPVVLVSRCFSGDAVPVYSYDGGGASLKQMGVIFCAGLNGPKALIRLTVGLSAQLNEEQLTEFMGN